MIVFALISLALVGDEYLLHFHACCTNFVMSLWNEAIHLRRNNNNSIFIMIIWLYALVDLFGYGLNMVTVSIAAISLGVGVDYVIHLIERYREEIEENPS